MKGGCQDDKDRLYQEGQTWGEFAEDDIVGAGGRIAGEFRKVAWGRGKTWGKSSGMLLGL